MPTNDFKIKRVRFTTTIIFHFPGHKSHYNLKLYNINILKNNIL